MTDTDARTDPVAVGLIGAGWIGAFHGETLARRLPGARLAGVADPAPGAAERLASSLGADRATTDPAELLADPAGEAGPVPGPLPRRPGRGRRRGRQGGVLRKAHGPHPGRRRPRHRRRPGGWGAPPGGL